MVNNLLNSNISLYLLLPLSPGGLCWSSSRFSSWAPDNVVSVCPSLLRGSEDQLGMLLSEEEHSFFDKLLQILVKASRKAIELSAIYPFLERACLEGTRLQSKYAISAIAAFGGASGQAFSSLYKKLVDSLRARRNISTVLQSLGCISQYSVSMFESREKEIKRIIQTIFHETDVQLSDDHPVLDLDSGCSTSCRLKIYGLKTLVKSFLPYQGTDVRHQIKDLFIILEKILPEGKFSDNAVSSENDTAHVRLAAAKSVLRLARRLDLHISPQIFHLVILKARDPSPLVRRMLLEKIHKLLRERAIPSRYACTFALAASDCIKDVQTNSLKYMEEFIRVYNKEARIHQASAVQDQGGTVTNFPGYIVVYLIHILAHDLSFPSEDCQDEEVYAQFCSPLVAIVQALVSASLADSSNNAANDTLSFMLNVFRAIRKAEDAIDVHKTSRLHILADIGVLVVKFLSHIMPSNLPGLMMLPSSFYKVSLGTTCDEVNATAVTHCPFDETSIEKVLNLCGCNVIGTSSALVKRGRKSQEDSMLLDGLNHTKSNHLLHKKADKSACRIKEEKENLSVQQLESQQTTRQVSTRGKTKREVSPGGNGVAETVQHEKGANGNTKPTQGRDDISSSCGSVITKPSSLESQVSVQEVDIVQCGQLGEKDRKATKKKSASSSEARLKDYCNSKEVGDLGERLIGQRIKLWSPMDKCFYSGSIEGFDSQNSSHRVSYDNGEVELLHLATEKWEIEASKFQTTPCEPALESSISSLMDRVTRGKASRCQNTLKNKRKEHIGNGKAPLFAGDEKRKKRHNLGF